MGHEKAIKSDIKFFYDPWKHFHGHDKKIITKVKFHGAWKIHEI